MQKIVDNHRVIEIIPPANYENLEEQSKFTWIHRFQLGEISIIKPQTEDGGVLTPNMCRLRNLNYSASIYINIEHTLSRVEHLQNRHDGSGATREQVFSKERFEGLHLCDIPVMLKSEYCHLVNSTEKECCAFDECPYDNGGYFVVNGSEKVRVYIIVVLISLTRILILMSFYLILHLTDCH